jgi:hypothetical protein
MSATATASDSDNQPTPEASPTATEFVYIVRRHDSYNGARHAGVYATLELAREAVDNLLRHESSEHTAYLYRARINSSDLWLVLERSGTGKVENYWD